MTASSINVSSKPIAPQEQRNPQCVNDSSGGALFPSHAIETTAETEREHQAGQADQTEHIHEAIERLATLTLAGVELSIESKSRKSASEPHAFKLYFDTNATIEESETAEATRNALANYFESLAAQFANLAASTRGLNPSFLTLSPAEFIVISSDGAELFRTPNADEAWSFSQAYSADGNECRIEPPLPQVTIDDFTSCDEMPWVDSWLAVEVSTNAIRFSSALRETVEEFVRKAGPEYRAVLESELYGSEIDGSGNQGSNQGGNQGSSEVNNQGVSGSDETGSTHL